MSGKPSNFPLSSVDDIKLSAKEKADASREKVVEVDDMSTFCAISNVLKEVEDRYRFSQYLIKPNQFKFSTVVRVLSYVLFFIHMLVKNKPSIHRKLKFLDVDESREADKYVVFPFKATIARKNISIAVIKVCKDHLTAMQDYLFL